MKNLGEKIRAARKKRFPSQEAAARALGVSLVTWNAYETGRIIPPLTRLQEITKLLGTTVSKLTSGL